MNKLVYEYSFREGGGGIKYSQELIHYDRNSSTTSIIILSKNVDISVSKETRAVESQR